jgi:hypothetical protein
MNNMSPRRRGNIQISTAIGMENHLFYNDVHIVHSVIPVRKFLMGIPQNFPSLLSYYHKDLHIIIAV